MADENLDIAERLSNIHFEHLIWFNELQTYHHEIEIFEKRIRTLVDSFEGDRRLKLDEFARSFNGLKKAIDDWQITIGMHEVKIAELIKMDGQLSKMTNSQHERMRKTVATFRRSMLELKEKFQFFISRQI